MITRIILGIGVFAISLVTGWQIDLSPQYHDSTDFFFHSLRYEIGDYFGQNIFLAQETRRIVSNMTPEEKVGQLLMPAFEKNNEADQVANWLSEYKLGGLMVLHNDLSERDTQEALGFYQGLEKSHDLPLFFSIDAEPSLLKYRLPQHHLFDTDSLVTINHSFVEGQRIANIMNNYGYNLNFAPVYDSNKNQTAIGNRSYGREAREIISLAQAFIDGQESREVLTTAKHFPGHGSVSGDTHYNLQTVSGLLPELDQFRGALERGVPFMMVGHLAVDGGVYDTGGYPATLSHKISTKLLKDELGFEGLVVTDALNMGALGQFVSKEQSIEEQALRAGADILLIPRDLASTYKDLITQMNTDDNFRQLVNEKVTKIVRMKLVWQWARNKTL